MDIDTDKIDEAMLALLQLTSHDKARAWKGHDWNVMDRLYRKGMICNPVGKAKSVVLTVEGLAESERLFAALFIRPETGSKKRPDASRAAPTQRRALLGYAAEITEDDLARFPRGLGRTDAASHSERNTETYDPASS